MKNCLRTLTLIAVIAFLYFAGPLLIPIFFSLFLAMLIDPLLEKITSRGFQRKKVSYVVAASIVVLLVGVVWVALFAVRDLVISINQSPRLVLILSRLRDGAGSLDSSVTGLRSLIKSDPNVTKVDVVEHYPLWFDVARSAFGSIFELASFALIVPMLLFYLLYEKNNLLEAFNSIIGKYVYLPTLNANLPSMVRTFFRANMITALLLISGEAILLFYLHFVNWGSLSIVIGVLNVIPIVGAPAAVLLVIVGGVVPDGAPFPFIASALGTVLLHFVMTNFALPSLIGGRANINTTTLIIGSLFWSWIWGAVGFLISIPMTLLIKIFLENNAATLPFANLMAARPTALIPDHDFVQEDLLVDRPGEFETPIESV